MHLFSDTKSELDVQQPGRNRRWCWTTWQSTAVLSAHWCLQWTFTEKNDSHNHRVKIIKTICPSIVCRQIYLKWPSVWDPRPETNSSSCSGRVKEEEQQLWCLLDGGIKVFLLKTQRLKSSGIWRWHERSEFHSNTLRWVQLLRSFILNQLRSLCLEGVSAESDQQHLNCSL